MANKIDTLVEDIHSVFTDPQHSINEDNLEKLGEDVKEVVKTAIQEAHNYKDKTQLRMSKIGTPNRKLWYEVNVGSQQDTGDRDDLEEIPVDPQLAMKFLYGHILEQVLLFFVRESNHNIDGEQDTLSIDDIEGHRDCKIDGMTVDIKTSSSFQFHKFKNGTILNDDPFGYIAQLSGYDQAENGGVSSEEGAAFLVLNKESGEITLLRIDPMDMINAQQRVGEIKKVVNNPEPPEEKCYSPQPLGKSGNMVLNKNCEYCPFKHMCWEDDANNGQGLRAFQYQNGVKHFTHIENIPNVSEITGSS